MNQPPAGQVPARPPHIVRYPYQPDEVIGGDSVSAIEWRLLSKKATPSIFDRPRKIFSRQKLKSLKSWLALILKEIGWDGPSIIPAPPRESEKLNALLEDLQSGGVNSDSFPYKSFFSFIDDYSRVTWIYLMK